MALHTTRWHPDTCECIIDISWDDTNAVNTRKTKEIVKACDAHKSLTSDNNLSVILEENKRKNGFRKALMDNVAALKVTTIEDGMTIERLRSDVTINFSYDVNRVLNVSISPSLTVNQVNNLKAFCDNKFGAGKVIINV